MKNLLLSLGAFLCFGSAIAQTNLLDKQLQNVNQSSVTSGIIYDRVTPLADLCVYNMPTEKPHNTADFRFFEQALFELYKASNYKKLVSIEQLEKKISDYGKEMNVVPIGMINTPFQTLNYNPENANESGLILKDDLFIQVSEKEPFLNGYALVVSPLKNVMQGEKIIYKFSDDLIFNNGDTKIKSLIADFGDGIKRKIIENGIITISEVVIENNKSNGDKKLNFIVELANDFTFNTNATIYTIQGNYTNNVLNSQPIACSSNLPANLIENFKIDYVQATDTFQGLNESVGLKGQIEPRVFYHTNNGNTQKTLLKPIIILDGFDPSDGRKIDDCDCERDPVCQEANKDKTTGIYNPNNHTSFVELMNYNNDVDIQTNLITVLRAKGYDVIVVNQPTYTTAGVAVDGGADFIERNAMAFVELVKEVNTKLQTNGSSEKLVVVGPSMGGQITRYALAYMEKKFAETGDATWQHNTRIWVAFDSPNHGANVPLGDQSLIKMLANDSVEALKSFNKLQTIAANEMLVNYYKEGSPDNQNDNYSNASTVSQGMPISKGNPYFQEHYDRQFNNGLTNSNGFPMNLRKLAIVNGSLTGETFGNGYEKMLDVRLSKRICLFSWSILGWHVSSCFNSKLFEAESYTMPTSNDLVAHTKKLNHGSIDFNASANSIRGNLDNIPGGYIDATVLLHSAITGAPLTGPRSFWQYTADSAASFYINHIGDTAEWDTRVLKPNQCFIPTYSSIGIKNPNQSWANPLNRNLVCSNETYFDSYFGEANNAPHVELNYRSVNWLLKEIGSNTSAPIPQAPFFPLQAGLLTGDGSLCGGEPQTYTFSNLCKIPSGLIYQNDAGLTVNGWSVEGPLQILSYTDYSVTVQATTNYSNVGKVIATFQNGEKYEKNVTIGVPAVSNSEITGGYDNVSFNYSNPVFIAPASNVTSYRWVVAPVSNNCANSDGLYPPGVVLPKFTANNSSILITTSTQVFINWGNCAGMYSINCYAVNECGNGIYRSRNVNVFSSSSPPGGGGNPCGKTLQVFPNPIKGGVLVVNIAAPIDPCNNPAPNGEIIDNAVKIYDLQGNLVFEKNYNTDSIEIFDLNLKTGNYALNVFTTDGEALKEIIVAE